MQAQLIRFCFLFFISPTLQLSTVQETCVVPSNPSNGKFDCKENTSILDCDLLCDQGYSAYPRSSISCSLNMNWTMTPSSLTCSPSVLLITGSTIGFTLCSVELYTVNLTCPMKRLPDNELNFGYSGHSLDYVDGRIISCVPKGKCMEMLPDNTWVELPNRPLNYASAQAVVRSKLFLIGGRGGNWNYGNGNNANSSQMLDLKESEEWKEGFKLKEHTNYGCAVTLSDERVAVVGTYRSGSLLPDMMKYDGVHIYNVEDGSVGLLKHLSIGRREMGCTAYVKDGKEYILVAGGWLEESSCSIWGCFGGHYLYETEIHEVGAGNSGQYWRVVGNLPWRGAFQVFNVEGGRIIGTHGYRRFAEFDLERETWTELPVLTEISHERAGIAAVPAARFGCV